MGAYSKGRHQITLEDPFPTTKNNQPIFGKSLARAITAGRNEGPKGRRRAEGAERHREPR
jgi:hypothetical protein